MKGNIASKYVFISLALEGVKEGLLNNKIKADEVDIKSFKSLKSLYGIVDSAIPEVESEHNKHLQTIKENVSESLLSIDLILKIVADKNAHQQLKMQLHDASMEAISSHLSKYSKAV